MPVVLVLAVWILAEIAGFAVVGRWLGVGVVLALVVVAAAAGIAVIRATGAAAAAGRLRGARAGGALAAFLPVGDAALRLLAGVLLIVPGFLGDLLGLALLVGPLRRALVAAVAARVAVAPRQEADAIVIDGEFYAIDDPPASRVPPPRGWTGH